MRVMGVLAATAAAILALPATASAKQSTSINQKESVQLYAGVGDSLVRVTLKESLPNAFGGADIFGRKRDRGFVEIRYMGQTPEGFAIFHRKTVDIYSTETTMSRSGMRFGQGSLNSNGYGGATVSGYSVGPAQATVQTLPPDTIQIVLDLSKNRIMTVEDRLIEVVTADGAGVAFRIVKRR